MGWDNLEFEEDLPEWVKVPKRYRVTRVLDNRYDLVSTLPLRLVSWKFPDLGAGYRVESKGWGTGAYRIYRISKEPLGTPQEIEPELVHVPAGGYWSGGKQEYPENDCSNVQKTIRMLMLDEFWIGRFPVTVEEFRYFVDHHGFTTSIEERAGTTLTWQQPVANADRYLDRYGRHPVTRVTKTDAKAYCRWLTGISDKIYTLPTRLQWEKAALGIEAQKYPWGDDDPDKSYCNTDNWYAGTTPVGQFSPDGDSPRFDNEYGCADMVGNVSEWVLDTIARTGKVHIECDPDCYYYKTYKYDVLCGASWRMKHSSNVEYQKLGKANDHTGFRVVARPKT